MVTIVRIVKSGFKSFWRNGWISTATIGVMTLALLVSAADSTPPAPSTLTADMMASDTTRLSWTPCPDPDFQRYELIRMEVFPPTATTVAIMTNKNQTTFDDINLAPERGYQYQVRTYNTAGQSSDSNIAFAYTHYGIVVPFVSAPIQIDGDFSDWEGIKEVFTDATGDSLGTLPGTDFTKFYLVRDNEYLYLRIDFANGLPPEGANILYHIGLDMPPRDGRPTPGDGSITFWNPQSRDQVTVYKILENESYNDLAALGDSSIETRARLDFIGNPDNFFTGVSVNENGQWVDGQDIPNTLFEASFYLKVPKFYQNDKYFEYNPEWPGELLGYLTNTTISQAGCALTSLVMVTNFWKAITTPDTNEPTNPSSLNRWLKDNDGYGTNSGRLIWSKIDAFSSKMHFVKDPATISCTTTNITHCRNTLNQDLAAGRPVIIDVDGHFVVAKGKTNSTWYINDPLSKTVQFLNHYNNRIVGLRRFEPGPAATLSSLNISAKSPVDLLITDGQGRKTGFDPITQTTYNEIPESLYYSERIDNAETGERGPTVKVLHLGAPENITYTLQVIGTDLGLYELEFHSSDINGKSTITLESGITQEDLISEYSINYSSQPEMPTTIEHIITISDVIKQIEIGRKLNLIDNDGIKNSLVKKLENAEKQIQKEQKKAAINLLNALINEVKAQKGKHIDSGFAAKLIEYTQYIIERL